MRTVIVTLMWGNAWERYGHRFIDSAARLWPTEWNFMVVAGLGVPVEKGQSVDLNAGDLWRGFMERYGTDPVAQGIIGPEGQYSWRADAIKWMPQALAPMLAAGDIDDGELFVWLDADVETLRAPPADFFEQLIGVADVAHLGREGSHSEIGYWSAKMSPRIRELIAEYAYTYLSGEVFRLDQQHSAFVWDHVFLRAPRLATINLTPGGRGHVWFQSPLGQYFDHAKGKRKDRGGSKESRGLRDAGT